MSWLSSIISGLFDVGQGYYNRYVQQQENEKDRNFNADEAEKNRLFQSKEAELAYERQVDFFEQHQSIGAQVNAYKAAGLNPALLAGGVSQGASPSAPAASGSQASSSGSSLPTSMLDFAKMALGFQETKARIEGIREDNRLKRAQAVGQEIDNLSAGDINSATIANLWSKTAEQDENRNLLIQKVLTESSTREQIIANTSLLTEKALSESKSREVASAQIGLISAQVGKISFDKIIARETLDNMKSLTKAQISEIQSNVSFLGERINQVSSERDFFDKVKQYRVNLEKARSDNADVAEKLSALSPILGKVDFPHQFGGTFDDKNSLYDKAYRSYLDTYLDIMIDVANSK